MTFSVFRVHRGRSHLYDEHDADRSAFLQKLVARKTIGANGYHSYISKSFIHAVPVPTKFARRFLPPFSDRTAFYASFCKETAIAEGCYHLHKSVFGHLERFDKRLRRQLFLVEYEEIGALDLRNTAMPEDLEASFSLVTSDPDAPSVIYPSLRKKSGFNVCVYQIERLSTVPAEVQELEISYENDEVFVSFPAMSVEPLVIKQPSSAED